MSNVFQVFTIISNEIPSRFPMIFLQGKASEEALHGGSHRVGRQNLSQSHDRRTHDSGGVRIISHYVTKRGIAQMCLCKTKYHGGGIAPFGRSANLPEKVSRNMGYRSDSLRGPNWGLFLVPACPPLTAINGD